MIYKAIVIDVDGTLIASIDAMPSRKVKEAILQLQKDKKIHITIATARPFKNIKKICKELQLSGYAIVSGGAQIIDLKTGKYLYEYPLDSNHTVVICKLIKTLNSNVPILVQDNGADYVFNEFYRPHKPFVIVVYGITEPVADEIIHKLSKLSGFFFTKGFSQKKGLFDIHVTHKKATKQHGIETLAGIWGISKEEIIGVGDGHNDFPLFEASGLKIAMGNAADVIKNFADFVAPTVENDGLAIAINKYL